MRANSTGQNTQMSSAFALLAVLSEVVLVAVPVDASFHADIHPREDGRSSQANTLAALLRLTKSRPDLSHGADANKCMAWLESLRTDTDAPVRAWQAARKAAGFEPLSDEQVRDRLPFMTGFFSTEHGGLVVRATKAQITYLLEYKVGNNMIRSNLIRLSEAVYRITDPRGNDQADAAVIDQATASTVAFLEKSARWARRVTFVRSPFGRFVSGYKEALYRSAKHHHRFVPREKHGHGYNRTAEAVAVVAALLDAQEHRLPHGIQHVFPMSGVLLHWDVDFIGRIENLEMDWRDLRNSLPDEVRHVVTGWPPKMYFPNYTSLDLHAGSHPEDKELPFKEELLLALRHRPDLLAGVRALLTPDTLCFGEVGPMYINNAI